MSAQRQASAASRRAIIAGAGFAGLTAGTVLAQRGWSVTIHERGESLREEGAGIVMWENSFKALESIGAMPAIVARSLDNPRYDTWLDGRRVSSEGADFRFRSLARQDLYESILDCALRAGVEITTGSEVVKANADGSILLASGGSARADVIIGADGVNSKVRDSLSVPYERVPLGFGMVRMLVDRPMEGLRGGDWDNIIDFWRLSPRFLRILYVPCSPDRVYLAFGADRSDPAGYPLDPIDDAVWISAFPQLTPLIGEAMRTDGFYHPYQTVTTSTWHVGRTVLVGDAIHGLCPALAQGAGQAICNAFALGVALDEISDVESACSTWAERMMPLTHRCQLVSRDIQQTRALSKGNVVMAAVAPFAQADPTRSFHQ